VERFCNRQLGFTGIAHLVTRVIDAHRVVDQPTLDQILEADRWARAEASRMG
jgi:1-deoxy-D-xylulose-5-phosphate reductoisomerase